MRGRTLSALIGLVVAAMSGYVGGYIVALGHPIAALALLVPIVAGLVQFGKMHNEQLLEERAWLKAVDAVGITAAYYAGLGGALIYGQSHPVAALWALVAVVVFVLVDRAAARRMTGSWLGTAEEVSR